MSTVANQTIATYIFYSHQPNKAMQNIPVVSKKRYFEITAIRREPPFALIVLILQPLTKFKSTDDGTIR